MISRFAFLLILWPLAAWADPIPGLYDVQDVASDDRLNIRTAPKASAERIGDLAPDATGIEVTATNESGTWGRVNLGEGSGWVSLRYLRAQDAASDPVLSGNLRCFGTEPFWSLELQDGQQPVFRTPDGAEPLAGTGQVQADISRAGYYFVGLGPSTAVIRRTAQCSDGMSDQLFGLAVDLIKSGSNQSTYYSGCCSLAP